MIESKYCMNSGCFPWYRRMELDSGVIWSNLSIAGVALIGYVSWVAIVRMRSYNQLCEMSPPDENDLDAHFAIFKNTMYIDFPTLAVKGLEFGLLKTYAIPSISKTLAQTRELVDNVPRRYDDTDLIMRSMMEHPPNSPVSLLAIRRLNALHAKYKISNADYLYVLTIFAVEPFLWIEKYGYRRVHPVEKMSSFVIWRDVGIKMGIENIPPSYEAMQAYLHSFEAKQMRYHMSNEMVAQATIKLFLSKVPPVLHPLGRRIIHAMCGEKLGRAFGFPAAWPGLPTLLHYVLLLVSAGATRYLLLPRSQPLVRTPPDTATTTTTTATCTEAAQTPLAAAAGGAYARKCPLFQAYEATYGPHTDGYRIDELGPEQFAAARELGPVYKETAASMAIR